MKAMINMIKLVAAFLPALLVSTVASGQVVLTSPQQFSLQASVRQPDGRLLAYSTLQLQVEILDDTLSTSPLYTETQTVTTSGFGVFSTIVGAGHINWGNGPYWLRAKVFGSDGTQLELTNQLVGVPYALNVNVTDSLRGVSFREKQELSIGHDTIYLTGGSYVHLPERFDGDYNHLVNTPPSNSTFANDAGYITTEVQVLTIGHDTVYLTGGSYVVLPAGFDGNYNSLTNKPTTLSTFNNDVGYLTGEQQILSIGHDTVYLTGGSHIVIPRRAERQSLDSATAIGNSAGNRQLKSVADPTDPQDVLTYHYLDSLLTLLNTDAVDRGSHTAITTAACDTFMWHGTAYTQSGTYLYQYSNARGFFSTDTLHLTVRYGSHLSQTIAAIDSYTWHGTAYTESGKFNYYYINDDGCPSVDTLRLTITGKPPCYAYRDADDTAVINVCGKIVWRGRYYTNAGVYQHNLGPVATDGCDSVVYVQINILQSYKRDTVARTTSGITWRGQTYTEQGDYADTMTAANGCDSIMVLHLSVGSHVGIGAAKGLFSVANGAQVRFSSGNLQYMSSDNYWRFADYQYDVRNISCAAAYNNVWSDLFGWATSGYHDPADTLNTQYQPWDHSKTQLSGSASQYNLQGYGPSTFMDDTNLTGSSRYYDWGQYNVIANGGNEQLLWRVMSRDEWYYLLHRRPDADNLQGRAQISGIPTASGSTTSVSGYVLLPDDWNDLPYLNFSRTSTNYYSVSQWQQLENAGAVFLPLSSGITCYWTSTTSGNSAAYCFALNSSQMIVAPYNRSVESFVRLVQDYTSGSSDCNCTYYDTTIVSSGSFSWHGQTYTQTGDYIETLTNTAGCDSIITLSLIIEDTGVLSAYFSVSDTHQVRFSKGNLQYKASDNLWRFAHHQYDYRGANNNYRSATYTGWIDLFPWASSGYHDSTDFDNTGYRPYGGPGSSYGPSSRMADWDLVNTSANYDWGVYNPIANGGNTPGQWRTLTYNEWDYLMYSRPGASSKRGYATVCGVRGMIILPDNWTLPSGVTFVSGYDFEQNIYGISEWAIMENAGAVFLPTQGTSAEYTYGGAYWSSTSQRTGMFNSWYSYAYIRSFGNGYFDSYKSNTLFVRLVKD